MANLEKLKDLVMDVLLIEESEYSQSLEKDQCETWDSLAVVSLSVGIDETFGYHLTLEEAVSVRKVEDLITILRSKGINFDA
jgi:acyl carrier protein